MIRLLVKKIVLYDDKIEVFYNIPGQDRPDGQEAHQAFCFHEQCFTYECGGWQYTKKGGKTYEMMLRFSYKATLFQLFFRAFFGIF